MLWPSKCGGLDQRYHILPKEMVEGFFLGAVSFSLNSFHYAEQTQSHKRVKEQDNKSSFVISINQS